MAKKRTGVAHWIAEADVPMLVLDRRWRVRVFNRGMQHLTGRETGEVIGQIARFTTGVEETPPGSVAELLSALVPSPSEFVGDVAAAPVSIPTPTGPSLQRAMYLPLAVPNEKDSHLLVVLVPPDAPPLPAAASLHTQLAAARQQMPQTRSLVASSAVMQRPMRQFDVAASSQASVHLVGDPGTGRRTMAAELYRLSGAPDDALLPIAIERPRHPGQLRLLASALSREPDTVATPQAVLLAEIEHLPLDVQAEIVAIGRDDVRLLTTSARPLATLVEADELLPEFAALLGTVTIELPPLRDRGNDLPLIAQAVIERTLPLVGREQPAGISEEALLLLQEYNWPGNITELDRCIEAAVRKGTGPVLVPDDFPFSLATGRHAQSLGPDIPMASMKDVLETAERAHLQAALERSKGSKSGAAKLLGMTRPKLYRRLAALGINVEEPNESHEARQ